MLKNKIILILLFFPLFVSAQNKEFYENYADSLTKIGQRDKLLPYFIQEEKTKPKNEDILRWLGYLSIEQEKFTEAEKYYYKALEVNPSCAACYSNLGRIEVFNENLVKAIEYVNKALILDPKDASFYAFRGQLREFNGDNSSAWSDYNKAIELDPKNEEYYLLRANYNKQKGYAALQLKDLNKAIEVAPEKAHPYLSRSEYYYEQRSFNEALIDINNAILLDSTEVDYYIGRGAIYSVLNKFTEAIGDYSRAIQFIPDSYNAFYYRSRAWYALEDMDKSCSDLKQCLLLLDTLATESELKSEIEYSLNNYCDDSKASYYYQRGIAQYNLNQFDKAIEVYSLGISKFPDNPMLISFRANAFMALHDYQKAIDDYDLAYRHKDKMIDDARDNMKQIELNTGSIELYVNGLIAINLCSKAQACVVLEKFDEAEKEINQAIEIAPKMDGYGLENYYNTRGSVYLGKVEFHLALNDFDKCIALNKNFELAYVNRAIAKVCLRENRKISFLSLYKNNNTTPFSITWSLPAKLNIKKIDPMLQSALDDCNKAIEINPKSAYAYFVRGQIKKAAYTNDYCDDFQKASQLGMQIEPILLKACK